MDGFTYYNIFETKGIEYVAIIIFFMILIPFWMVLSRKVKFAEHLQKILGTLSLNALRIPQGLFFSKNHTWTHLEKTGTAKVGVDDLLLHVTGKVEFINHKNQGEKIKRGDLIAELDQQGKRLKIYSPISGEIEEINSFLSKNPATVNSDPYDSGWMFSIKPSDWKSDTSSLLLADEAIIWTRKELEKFREFVSRSMGKYSFGNTEHVLQDGGELYDHTLSELPDEIWADFQQEFLNPDV